jgi:glycosyltransferase involved in cell wall biosynthesis
MELTILMPCLNEAETIGVCIDKALGFLRRAGVEGEVLVADNGSRDGSQAIAESRGARVVPVSERGYGAALRGGIAAARGRYIIMGDADNSYDFSRLEGFLDALRNGADLVMGNRFAGGIERGAMPLLHHWLGNPLLSFIGRLFFKIPIHDFHCGLRGFNTQTMRELDLRTSGMEFASEMVVRAALEKLRVMEVPTTLAPDGRSRPPHLRTWRDGWRHLKFLLIYSPRWLFLYPACSCLRWAWLWPVSCCRVLSGSPGSVSKTRLSSPVACVCWWVYRASPSACRSGAMPRGRDICRGIRATRRFSIG